MAEEEEQPTELIEARRVVDNQIETARKYGDRAETLVRITLTILGLYASALVIVAQFLPNWSSSPKIDWPSLGAEALEQRILAGLEFANPSLASIIATIPIIAISVIMIQILTELEELPDEFLSSLKPSRLQSGIRPRQEVDDLLAEYSRIISENETEISSMEESWEKLTSAVTQAIGGSTLALLIVATLIFGDAGLILYVSAFCVIVGLAGLVESDIGYTDVEPYIFTEKSVDTASLFVFIPFSIMNHIVEPSDTLLILLIWLLTLSTGLIGMIYAYVQLNHQIIRKLALRNIGLFILSLVLLAVYVAVQGEPSNLTPIASVLTSLTVTASIHVVLCLLTWLVDLLLELMDWVLQDKPV